MSAPAAPVQIPGFYYDTAKKKYFRLLPHHAAPPSAAFYSTSSVQKAQKEATREWAELADANRRKSRIRHSPLKSNPYVRATLYREMGGVREELAESRREVYARSLKCRPVYNPHDPTKKISAFATDFCDGAKRVAVGTGGGVLKGIPLTTDKDGQMEMDDNGAHNLICSWSQVTSISISTRRLLVATFLGNGHNPSIYMTRLPSPSSTLHFSNTLFEIQSILHHPTKSLWTSTASPHSDGALVLGSSGSAILLTDHPHDVTQQHFRTRSDVFAVAFHATDPSVFLAGSRDGAMRLFDIRNGSGGTGVTAARPDITVRHSSTITHVRALDASNILVNGLQGAAMYDLRFPHPASPSSSFAEPTRAARAYPRLVRNDGYMIDLGFDVNQELGIMAIANQEHRVELWSIATGERLDGGDIGKKKFSSPCKGLKFEGGMEPMGLWAIDGSQMEFWQY
ncbi:hypothetical protein EDC01DRAFT_779625 [Geopyxis carbonaria]|nr:hypothetical protein EDC01DRAFT_779625 [Geopyxis carbonaria]